MILVELFDFEPSAIPYSFKQYLSSKHKANIFSYYPKSENFIVNIKNNLKKLNPLGIHKIYKSFGVRDIIKPRTEITKTLVKEYKKIIKKIKIKMMY